MSLAQAQVAANLAVHPIEVARALDCSAAHHGALRSDWLMANGDTPHRRRMRSLLDGAGLVDCAAQLAFVKNDGSLRYMLCTPVPGCDRSARYVTVKDLEKSREAGRSVFRRVDLDTIARCQIDYSIIGAV